ncbi:hypothetical protein [Pseudoduganella sp. R-34]|uniref:hypothetical protein n=1 Tax=Pseudoduganella sp. R-34 TaxID=3404062 RepID=UPI003CE68090
MFEQNTIIKSSADAEAWLRAVVEAYGSFDVVSFPVDCAEIVEHFARAGVAITINDANSFWNAHSDNQQSGWVTLATDCVAALDWLVEDIESGACQVSSLKPLRGTVRVTN